jgi:hypothetical protein
MATTSTAFTFTSDPQFVPAGLTIKGVGKLLPQLS